jgi:hypothetical protein
MDLSVTQESTEDGTRRTLHLENLNDGHGRLAIVFDLLGERDVPQPRVLDGFVFGIVFYAMRLGQPIRIHGAVSREALRNLNEFQEAWTLWKRNPYRKVDILPDEWVEGPASKPDQEAIAAFSGGVDSIFTVLRHAGGRLGLAAYPLRRSLLMVHGFDVPLGAPRQLDALQERVKPLVDELGLAVRTIRTNLKQLALQDWGDSFAAQLACCLHNYSHEFTHGLVGSSEPYNELVLPWGSNPATDHLLSGAAFRIVHDGAGYSRTQKVEELARNPVASRVVKVCWEGKETFKNCGVCEKCMRTRLNFLAAGVPDPECFDTPLDTSQIDHIDLQNAVHYEELVSIVSYARNKGIGAEWVDRLERRTNRYLRPTRWQSRSGKLKAVWQLAKQGQWREIALTLQKAF